MDATSQGMVTAITVTVNSEVRILFANGFPCSSLDVQI